MTPEQAAGIANRANVGLLVFYHLLPAPDGALARRVFARGSTRSGRATGRSPTTAVSTRCRSDPR